MSWQTPKTNWAAGNSPNSADFNRIEENINIVKTSIDDVDKDNVGLGNVKNVEQMPIAGGTFTGVAKAQSNTSYTTAQIRNVILSTGSPTGGSNGDIWIKYR